MYLLQLDLTKITTLNFSKKNENLKRKRTKRLKSTIRLRLSETIYQPNQLVSKYLRLSLSI